MDVSAAEKFLAVFLPRNTRAANVTPMNSRSPLDWQRLDELVRHDPAGRGLASYRDPDGAALADDLAAAALDLAHRATRVLLVTGFAIVTPDGLRAETDGPPGAVFLAGMLRACEIEVDIATDSLAAPLVLAGLRASGLADVGLITLPDSFSHDDAQAILADDYSHLVAIERVGPNHTEDSIVVQDEAVDIEDDTAQLAAFDELVAPEDRDTCRNMRGERIDEHTPALHLLFERDELSGYEPDEEDAGDEEADDEETGDEEEPDDEEESDDEEWIDDESEDDEEEPQDDFDDADDEEFAPVHPTTIGIADGGNEIGCGKIRWDVLRRAVARGPGELTACRIATDYLIVAGISNWGAYGLGAAAAAIRDHHASLEAWTPEREAEIIRAMVMEAGAVDGTTKRSELSIDGLALEPYLETFEAIRRTCLGA